VGVTTSQIAGIEGIDEFVADRILHVVVQALWRAGHIKKEERDRTIGEDPG